MNQKKVSTFAIVFQLFLSRVCSSTSIHNYVVVTISVEHIPTIQQNVKAALDVLSKDDEGFFLMYEQGDIDWSAHGTYIYYCVQDEIQYTFL
jgi:alkaline phosphatase